MFVAYLGKTGYERIRSCLEDASRRRLPMEVYCGLDLCVTHPDALRSLSGLIKKNPHASLFLIESSRGSFHPKLYCFFSPRQVSVVAGSANLTGGGLAENVEASLYETVPDSDPLVQQIKDLRDVVRGVAEEATEFRIRQYERRFRITEKKRTVAMKEAERAIRQVQEMKLATIKHFLDLYRTEADGQARFSTREQDYRKAKIVLNRLCDDPVDSPADFRALYARLVGEPGQKPFWSSGGLQRSKNKIARNFRVVIEMIRAIRNNLSLSDAELFRVAKDHADKVPGLGVNVLTEVMNTFAPRKFAVLNGNPIASLEFFGCAPFRSPNSFRPEDYASFNAILGELRQICELGSMAHADHFLNFVYWKAAKKHKQHP